MTDNMPPVADMQTPELVALLADLMREKKWMLTTAESCTGGLIAGACTEVSGSSEWFERGFVTYSNDAKIEMLGVDPALIVAHGAVSEPVARAMVQGARTNSRALVAVGVTGVAGPTGGTAEKPVGTVWFGWDVNGQLRSERRRFDGDRSAIRAATVRYALQTLVTMIRNFPQ